MQQPPLPRGEQQAAGAEEQAGRIDGFADALEAAAGAAAALPALGRAYVGFARSHPGLLLLMFRSPVLDAEDAGLESAKSHSFAILSRVAAAGKTEASQPRALASWCLVHGFAMLLLDGRLPPAADVDSLLEAVLGAR